MARKIIITEKISDSSAVNHYRFVLWLTVPTARRPFYADPLKTSVLVGTNAPSNPELTDIRNGVIVEEVADASWPVGTPIAQIQSELTQTFNERQAFINSYNPWVRYGNNWDGTSWTNGGVA